MIPGTTPTHTFRIPVNAADVAAIRITYDQSQKTVLQKELEDCTVTDGQVVTKLTQEETLKFKSNVEVRIQIKVRTVGGDVMVSDIMKVPAYIVLDEEAI